MNDEERQNILNVLRKESLDYRAASLNRWLSVTGLVLTFFGIVVVLVGWWGFGEFRDIKTSAEESMAQTERYEEEAREIMDKIRAHSEAAGAEAEKLRRLAKDLGAEDDPSLTPNDPESLLRSVLGVEELSTVSGSLPSDERSQQTIRLPSSGEYWFAGECDRNCADLDLVVYKNDSEDFLGEDLLFDAFPVVHHRAADPENVTVEVIMVDCRADECGWSLTVYAGQQSPSNPG